MTNEELAEKAKRGDEEAFGKLWNQTNKLYYWFAQKYFALHRSICEEAWCNFEDLKSLMPVAFMKTVEKWDDKKGYKFSTFARFYVWNECRDFLKARRKSHLNLQSLNDILSDDDSEGTEQIDFLADPDSQRDFEKAELFELRRELNAAVDKLCDSHKRIIRALYFEGKEPEEVARELGIPVRNVLGRRDKALSKLRKPQNYQLHKYKDLY